MGVLDKVHIVAEPPAGKVGLTENSLPLLHEIRHALKKLLEKGEPTTIDLSAIPFGPGDEDRMLSVLGEGEVSATVDVLGLSHIKETRYPGVWLVDHRNPENERIAFQIVIADVPDILSSQQGDIQDGMERLTKTLITRE